MFGSVGQGYGFPRGSVGTRERSQRRKVRKENLKPFYFKLCASAASAFTTAYTFAFASSSRMAATTVL